MSHLVPLSQIQQHHNAELGNDYYDPRNRTVYGADDEKIGKIDDALVEENTAKIRYFVVDVGGWFSSKQVLIPAGLAQFRDDEVYISNLTKDRAENLERYKDYGYYTYEDAQAQDQRVFGDELSNVNATDRERYYTSPDKLELLEERLRVGKERFVAGTLEIGKRVVSNEQTVNVALEEEKAFISRHPVEGRPVDREIGADDRTVSVELEAERAKVDKQTYVAEEVEVNKTTTERQEAVTDTVRHEELDIRKTGDVKVTNNAANTQNRSI